MSATHLEARPGTDPRAGAGGEPLSAVRIRQTPGQWGYLIAWFGLLFVVLPFLLRPEDWREKLWISAGFLALLAFGHLTTYTAVQADGLTLSRWFATTTIPWSEVTGVQVTGRLIRRVYVAGPDGMTVLPAPTSGPLNWDRRFTARATAIQAAIQAAIETPMRTEMQTGEAHPPVPRPRTPAE